MAYVSKQFIDRINEEADLETVINAYLDSPLKKSGSILKAKSPFTDENSASFTVSKVKSIWKDFSSGKGGSTAVSFVMAKTGCSYPEAIEAVAKTMNIEVEYDDSKTSKKYFEEKERKETLRPLLQETINQYHKLFLELPETHPAKLEVFGKRGYTMETVEKYQIGFAPAEGKFIYNLCIENGQKQNGLDLALISTYGDKFRNRVIYPIFQKKANTVFPVGLAGRDLSGDKKAAKWINSADSVIYKKDKTWYGLDYALQAIVDKKEAWLVEGYNDVIAWQNHGILNTIAGCGTAIAYNQIQILKKYCDKVVFCMDPDAAGIRSMLKYIPEFLAQGFRVETVMLPGTDPDDFVREYAKSVNKYSLNEFNTDQDLREDGFKLLIKEFILNSKGVSLSKNTKDLCSVIGNIEDDAIQNIYSEWLAKESGVKISQINKWVKLAEKNNQVTPPDTKTVILNSDGNYILPPSVKEPVETYRPVIEKYQMFIAANQIWMQINFEDPPFRFKSVSNFSIEIIQHMQDEKFPMKLIKIKNIHGLEKIFDIQSESINTPMAFDNAVTAHGNFLWKGGRNEHQKLRAYLFDRMGTGRKIDVLGWQPEGFWCWNNEITIPGQKEVSINNNGVFEKGNVSYYVPSANEIYQNNPFKYEAQKKVVVVTPSVTFNNYATQLIKVHRNHGITAILFTIASIFQDIVVNQNGNFPMLFLYGPASSGKDQLAEACQSFLGQPQTGINLEGGVSTIKAQVREFAQFSNMISHLSEYKTGDSKLDGVLKGLWDRRGYKRGNIDSHVGTESIPILSSVIMTGNYTPDAEALITRLVWEEMNKTVFSDEEIKEYDKLSDMTKQGVSGFTRDMIHHRELVSLNFKRVYREIKATFSERMPEAKSRMITNASVLTSFYQIFKDHLQFPFSLSDIMDHFQAGIDTQTRKLNSASIINRWWDCFLASMRGTLADQLRVGRDFKIEGNLLYFQFTNCYNKIQRQWWSQYHDTAPGKTIMLDSIRKEQSYIEDIKSVRMTTGRESKSTSACVIQLELIPIAEELKYAIEFQLNENSLFGKTPATPENENDNEFDFLKDM